MSGIADHSWRIRFFWVWLYHPLITVYLSSYACLCDTHARPRCHPPQMAHGLLACSTRSLGHTRLPGPARAALAAACRAGGPVDRQGTQLAPALLDASVVRWETDYLVITGFERLPADIGERLFDFQQSWYVTFEASDS